MSLHLFQHNILVERSYFPRHFRTRTTASQYRLPIKRKGPDPFTHGLETFIDAHRCFTIERGSSWSDASREKVMGGRSDSQSVISAVTDLCVMSITTLSMPVGILAFTGFSYTFLSSLAACPNCRLLDQGAEWKPEPTMCSHCHVSSLCEGCNCVRSARVLCLRPARFSHCLVGCVAAYILWTY